MNSPRIVLQDGALLAKWEDEKGTTIGMTRRALAGRIFARQQKKQDVATEEMLLKQLDALNDFMENNGQ